jgi:hypothetical protein
MRKVKWCIQIDLRERLKLWDFTQK